MTSAHTCTIDTPIGPFTAIVAADGAVLGSGWTDDAQLLRAEIHRSIRPTSLRVTRDLGAVTAAVRAYHRGDLAAIETVPVRQRGGPFIEHAWDVLRAVPAGEPITYTEFARRAGRPDAVRAAAAACAANATALFVPCHRVRRIGGGLGGFRWGLPVKRWLIDHEAG